MTDTLSDAFLATFKVDDVMDSCPYLSYPIVSQVSSKFPAMSFSLPGGLILVLLGSKLHLLCDLSPKSSL